MERASNALPPEYRSPLATRIFRFIALLVAAWCVMTLTHELGHIVGGWWVGGVLVDADVAPWRLPYSIFVPDPMPLVTLWCGPIVGVAAPLGAALALRREWSWFIANFCILANGTYLSLAWVSGDRHLDTPRLLENGASPIALAVYCALTVVVGYVRFRRSTILIFATKEAFPTRVEKQPPVD